jgi:hypothetical protein
MTLTAGRVVGALLIPALALAGCTVAHSSPAAGHPPATAHQSVSTALPPEQRAEADADAILAGFAVPPGARRLVGPPTGKASQMKDITRTPGS